MDRRLDAPRGRWMLPWRAGLAALALGAVALALHTALPRVPRLAHAPLATVQAGEFRDELLLRARVEPLQSVWLDAQEGGRIEEVFATDGEQVAAGAPLYRLHSREQEQLLLQRGAEVAQQLANASLQRTALAAHQAQARRELLHLHSELDLASEHLARQRTLAATGFVSDAALRDAERRHRLSQALLAQAREDQQREAQTRRQSLAELDQAVKGLQQGLALLQRAREGWLARAPVAGRLSGFTPQLGATLRPGERLGRIDHEASGTRLVAEVDEFFLARLQVGQQATSPQGALRLAQLLPQVQGGKARALLKWTGPPPAPLRPGQSVDLRLHLAQARPALLLPDAPGVQSTLFVRDGEQVRQRRVQLGARAAGQVEVLAGLQAGDEVLLSALPPPQQPAYLLP